MMEQTSCRIQTCTRKATREIRRFRWVYVEGNAINGGKGEMRWSAWFPYCGVCFRRKNRNMKLDFETGYAEQRKIKKSKVVE